MSEPQYRQQQINHIPGQSQALIQQHEHEGKYKVAQAPMQESPRIECLSSEIKIIDTFFTV